MIATHENITPWITPCSETDIISNPRNPKFVEICLAKNRSTIRNTCPRINLESNFRSSVSPPSDNEFVMGTAGYAVYTTQRDMKIIVCSCSKGNGRSSCGHETVGGQTIVHLVIGGSSADLRRC